MYFKILVKDELSYVNQNLDMTLNIYLVISDSRSVCNSISVSICHTFESPKIVSHRDLSRLEFSWHLEELECANCLWLNPRYSLDPLQAILWGSAQGVSLGGQIRGVSLEGQTGKETIWSHGGQREARLWCKNNCPMSFLPLSLNFHTTWWLPTYFPLKFSSLWTLCKFFDTSF